MVRKGGYHLKFDRKLVEDWELNEEERRKLGINNRNIREAGTITWKGYEVTVFRSKENQLLENKGALNVDSPKMLLKPDLVIVVVKMQMQK